MFKRILIANRGEIACRVIDTCRKMGVETVAVHSTADAGSRHVAMATEAVEIGGPAPAESYLRGDVIIQAALDTGAEAIHPGYGFLSENPDFVEAVEKAGLVFIGPSAKAIRAMGLKDAAKKLMEEAGVPVVPGYHGADQDDDLLAAEAGRIGYPVLIKAVAGGGGKGMRKVDAPDGFAEALASARAEARTAFGNEAVLIEKFVTSPRHIEVQVFGDGSKAVHLFERDCSLQRRHQKVIEEAPAPGMTFGVRAAMGAAAVRAAEAIGYAGAGTIEFIVDGSDGLRENGFWFMEMNTRLQVEHPVTEEITGVDLVEWQLRVASGEPLPAAQEDLTISGHSFEARLYAEDVPAGFLPATGRLTHLSFPEGSRAETGVETGDTITPHYDPMIAKLVVHGPDRASALEAMSRALAGTQVAGTVTNLAFLKALADHEGFRAGEVDTGLIDREIDTLAEPAPMADWLWAQAALMAVSPGASLHDGFSLWTPVRHPVVLEAEGESRTAMVSAEAPGVWTVSLGETVIAARKDRDGWRIGGQRAVPFHLEQGAITLFDGVGRRVGLPDPAAQGGAGGPSGDVVEAPMPGAVKAVFVAVGDTVAEGDRVALMEAMKMEHTLRAPRDGVVAQVGAAEGDQVEAGALLVLLEPES
ncbi:MAG: 3-methylcrotonyl-CoA carboxylase [Proteobacteria bacterium]|nr:MAG: 3-methylcrotonyl-CoA carboxylase [Pseudomonadota bacterium]